ncbi:MAG: RNA pseudouridine synthase [Clostridia bacterium]|nr:RNA pseudouridine synthase [Clostridia bacterium]
MQVIYEDNHVIVVNKPQGIPSQADKTQDEDMLTLVKKYLKEKYNKPGEAYCGLVHRLDRSTAGLMLFAKTSKAASRISEYIRNGDFKKEYVAVVCKKMQIGKKETLENYLVKDERNNISKVVSEDTKNAKLAKLEYEVIGNIDEYSYIRVKLFTGRHHQIRVQMANIGCPLYGDIKYGGKKGKLALFACYLKTYHPTKDEYLEFELLPEKTGIWKGI